MNTKFLFLISFVTGMVLGSVLFTQYTVKPVQAISSTETTTSPLAQPPRSQLVESAIYFVIYVMIMGAGTLIWKKVDAQKPHPYRASRPMHFHSI